MSQIPLVNDRPASVPASDWPLSGAIRRWFILLLVIGTLVRFHQALHPFDYRTLNSWREADYVQVARSYFVEGQDVFHPRIDWRGTTNGNVEMEFPFLPYSASLLYRLFTYDERILRLLSVGFSIAALYLFAAFSRRFFHAYAALTATALFSLHGLLIGLSGGIQPEPLQLLLSVLTVWSLLAWNIQGRPSQLLMAGLFCGLAILAKSPSALLGPVLAYYVLRKHGLGAFRLASIYGAAALAILPPLAWYSWAHGLYEQTGLSLGLSNETHFINREVVEHPLLFLLGVLRYETWEVFSGFGVVLGIVGLFSRDRSKECPLVWLTAGALFYLVTIHTSGGSWAFYYHMNTVAPACLLMGIGFGQLWGKADEGYRATRWSKLLRFAGVAALALTITGTAVHGYQLIRTINSNERLKEMYTCLKSFSHRIEPEALILVRGGRRYYSYGYPGAYNESMAFAWMNRRGYNYAVEDYTLATIQSYAEKGVMYWIAGEADVRDRETFDRVLLAYPQVDSCGTYCLIKLHPSQKHTDSTSVAHPTETTSMDCHE